MMVTINNTNMQEALMEDIFSQFEQVSYEMEKEESKWELTYDEFLEIETEAKWFNEAVESGLIELNWLVWASIKRH